jgi:hypothetical protein
MAPADSPSAITVGDLILKFIEQEQKKEGSKPPVWKTPSALDLEKELNKKK